MSVTQPSLLPARRIGGRSRGAAQVASAIWGQRKARAGLFILGAFILMALLAPLVSPYSPSDAAFPAVTTPSGAHLLGTTGDGKDVLAQLLYGSRNTLAVSLGAAVLATTLALTLGVLAGYLGGAVDAGLNFLMNVLLVIPSLPLMIVISTYNKGGGTVSVILVIVVVSWAFGGRVVRSRVQSIRTLDFVTAAQFSGDRTGRIIVRELLPNMVSLLAVIFFATATAAVIAEAGLDFLGLASPTTISWGTMLYSAQTYNVLSQGQWADVLAPGLCIALLATAFALINFGIDQLSNPRLRS